ncbi:hypothetical protein BDR03DRAFT_951785 [Suillus americanus]|nr:hypothetical protein BDR03DRAFT_951785 [Suillus americanus]
MRLSFVLAVIAAFKLTVSMPVADSQCPWFCDSQKCCPGYDCVPFMVPDGIGYFCVGPYDGVINSLLLSARLAR